MISAILGNPGEGKSVSSAKLIKELLDSGVRVYTNLHLKESRRNYYYFSLDDYEIVYSIKDGVVILDEGQFILDAREWANLPKAFRQLLQKGRHEGLDFVIITQNMKQVDVSAQRLVHEAFVLRKIVEIRKFNFSVFLKWAVRTPVDGDNLRHLGLPSIIFATKKDFDYYNSYALRSGQKDLSPHLFDCVVCGVPHELRKVPKEQIQAKEDTPKVVQAIHHSLPTPYKIQIKHMT